MKIVAAALREHPEVNSTFEGDAVRIHEGVNIGIATATEQGLLVPVVHGADAKTLTEVAKATKALVEKARAGRLSLEDVSGGTFTITNLGMFGVETFTPMINPPQTAILGVGRVVEKPVVHHGRVTIRRVVSLSLTVDHRALDGASGAAFLARVKGLLENPYEVFLVR